MPDVSSYLSQIQADLDAGNAQPMPVPAAPAVAPQADTPSASPVQGYLTQIAADIANTAPADMSKKGDAGYIAQEGIKGAASLPSAMAGGQWADAQSNNYSYNWMADKLGLPQANPIPAPVSPEALSKAALGDTYSPDSAIGQYGGAAARAVGGALPIVATGGAAALPTLGGAAVGGVTGQAARDVGSNFTDNPYVLGGLDAAGNLIGGYAGTAGLLKRTNDISSAAKTFADANVRPSPTIVADASPNTSILPGIGQGASLNPFTGMASRGANAGSANSLKTALGDLADNTSPVTDASRIGGMVQGDTANWKADQLAKFSSEYTQVRSNIDPAARIPATETKTLLGAPPDASMPAEPPAITQLRAALDKTKGSMTYDQLQAWKGEIGDAADNATGPAKGLLDRTYTALNNDRTALVGSQDPNAASALPALDARYSDFKTFGANVLKKMNDEQVTGGQVWNRITSGADPDANVVGQLASKGIITQPTQQAIAAQTLREMGQNPATGEWNLAKFVKNYSQMSDAAKQNIFGYDPDMLSQYNRLGNLATQIAKSPMPSKTGFRFLQPFMKYAGIEGIGEAATGEGVLHAALGGHPLVSTALGAVAAPVGATYALARLMATKPFINYLSKPVTSQQKFIAGLTGTVGAFHPALQGDIKSVVDALPSE